MVTGTVEGAGLGAANLALALCVTPTRSWSTMVTPPTVVAMTNIPNRIAHARAIRSSTMARIIGIPQRINLVRITMPTCLINVYDAARRCVPERALKDNDN
jgi:hypothetical protein